MIALDFQILGPALVAGLLVLATHVPLGMAGLERNNIFINIALAQAAATGVVFGRVMGGDADVWIVQASAIGAALLCAALLLWTDRRHADRQEAVIGSIYVSVAALLFILLPYDPGGAAFLSQLLIGQILWVGPLQLVIVGLIYAVALAIWHYRDLNRDLVLFHLVFAVVVALSVQIAGVLVVFATLIVPGLAARAAPPRWRHLIAFNVGVAGYLAGLVVSLLFNIPAGASIICALVPAALAAWALIRRAAANDGAATPAKWPRGAG
jgi:zinc/manganese transport system permease protein